MTDKEFRRLSRADLIEIIYELQKNERALQEENQRLRQKLEDRRVTVAESGSLAEVLAKLNGLFEAAQTTAEDYVAEARRTRQQAEAYMDDVKRRAAELASIALKEREDMLAKAEEECRALRGAEQQETGKARPRQGRGDTDGAPRSV